MEEEKCKCCGEIGQTAHLCNNCNGYSCVNCFDFEDTLCQDCSKTKEQ